MANQILVVEDEQGLSDLLEYFLSELGYTVLTAKNGQAALNILALQPVVLIISDVMMPVKDGYEFVKALRLLPLLAKIPVMLISAGPIIRAKLTPFKAEAYMAKPFELDQLEATIYSLIEPAF